MRVNEARLSFIRTVNRAGDIYISVDWRSFSPPRPLAEPLFFLLNAFRRLDCVFVRHYIFVYPLIRNPS